MAAEGRLVVITPIVGRVLGWFRRYRRPAPDAVVFLVAHGRLLFATADDEAALRAVDAARRRAARLRGMDDEELDAQRLGAPRVLIDFDDRRTQVH